jgi:NADH:ubiquinone oxidoreductase subunit 6 (subunit J)
VDIRKPISALFLILAALLLAQEWLGVRTQPVGFVNINLLWAAVMAVFGLAMGVAAWRGDGAGHAPH